jgi:hypothetical protein
MKLHIPNPCPQNWNAMIPSSNGRYCKACEKVVVDFTKMSTEEIKYYFEMHAEQKTCGHFYASQLAITPQSKLIQHLLNRYKTTQKKTACKIPRLLTLCVLGFVLSLMGCNPDEEVEGKTIRGDSIAVSIIDTNNLNKLSENEIINNTDTTTKKDANSN